MKSQHRHELQTNELADRIGRYVQTIRPYSQQIGIAALVVLIGAAVATFMWSRNASRVAAGWSDYLEASAERNPQALAEVAEAHRGNTVAAWAAQAAGDVALAEGTRQMFVDREEAAKSLKTAEEHFLSVERSTQETLLLSRARFGLGQVYETLAETDKAQQYYEKLLKTDPESALGKAARRRLDELSNKGLDRWYAWFDRQEPPQPKPPAGIEPNVPTDLDTLPSGPDISFPGLTPSPSADDASPAAVHTPADQPATSTEPATSEPATTEPATTEPSMAEPAAMDAAPAEPAAAEPAPAKSAPAESASAEPASAEPAPAEPAPAEPASAEPAPAEPAPAEPAPPAESPAEPAADAPAPAGEAPAEPSGAAAGANDPQPPSP